MADILVVKIGGSTLGAHDTTLEDVVALQRRGLRPVVVHGGGALISEWLKRHGVPPPLERGRRCWGGSSTSGASPPGRPPVATPSASPAPTAACSRRDGSTRSWASSAKWRRSIHGRWSTCSTTASCRYWRRSASSGAARRPAGSC